MTVLQQIIALVFTPTAIIAVLAFLLRGFFQQLLNRDVKRYELEIEKSLESHKAQLTQEYESSRLRLENELQKQFYQYQTKFSAFHQKQVEVMSELYESMTEAIDKLEYLLVPLVKGLCGKVGMSAMKEMKELTKTDIMMWSSHLAPFQDFIRRTASM